MLNDHTARGGTGTKVRLALVSAVAALLGAGSAALARDEGVDVSEFQGSINWSQVAGSGRTFAFIRSTRGGSTGSSTNSGGSTVGAGRYDDVNFNANITNAKNAGLWVAPYHFARADIVGQDPVDEANHFLQVAGQYMTSGYLRPVLDLESGNTNFTQAGLTAWALAFTGRIVTVKGEAARPIIYMNRSYANDEVNDTTTDPSYPTKTISSHLLWLADWDSVNSITSQPVNHQTDATPPGTSTYPNPLGRWGPDTGNLPKTWMFWQYDSTGNSVPGIPTNVDLDVFHSDAGSGQTLSLIQVPEPGILPLAGITLLALRRRRRAAASRG